MLLENAIFLDDESAIDNYTKIATDPQNREKIYSILRLSRRNEKISLSLNRITPFLSAETNKNTKDWIQSVEELIVY